MKGKAILKFTIPDADPEEQIALIKGVMKTMQAIAKLTGEEVDMKPFEDKIKELESDKHALTT